MEMNKPKAGGFTRIINAFFYSIKGFKAAFKNEAAFRQEIFLLPIIIVLAGFLAKNGVELSLMIGSFGLVLMAELVNSALECVVDRISFEKHPLSGQAKDIGSAIVLLALILCGLTWLSILLYR